MPNKLHFVFRQFLSLGKNYSLNQNEKVPHLFLMLFQNMSILRFENFSFRRYKMLLDIEKHKFNESEAAS